MKHLHSLWLTGLLSLSASVTALAQGAVAVPDIRALLDGCNVSWDIPGPTSAQSMPVGNGDIGLNVWVEANGDISFYIGKTDAWDQGGLEGPRKLGAVHISMNPGALGPGVPFTQVLKLHEGEIEIREGAAVFRIWVDANNPVIRVESHSPQPLALKVALDDWRVAAPTKKAKDVILPGQANRIAWYHRNDPDADAQTANLTFGGVIQGEGFASQDAATLQSGAATSHLISVYPLTATTDTPEQWLAQLERNIGRIAPLDLDQTRAEHLKWWDQFWQRSWIFVRGDEAAKAVTEGYVLQRFITACSGRGGAPIKFNGSIFTVDNPDFQENQKPHPVTADYRSWGGQYWFQNTRLMYWPRLAAGDFDLMQPLFKMYTAALASNAAQVRDYYKHGGSYIAETAPFWGGLKYAGPEVPSRATLHYFTPVLELSMMMLDYYEYTGDEEFARETLVPTATTGIRFFTEHFGRDADGKLLLDPDNAIETYHKAHDPAPDIAGLIAVTRRLLALPDALVDAETRRSLLAFQKIIPPLPTGLQGDQAVLLPYTEPPATQRVGPENPELYAVFPFRLYGVGKPGFPLALATFNVRQSRGKGGWSQEPLHAAMMGLADIAKGYVVFNFTNKEPRLKFPAFWASQQDYTPNQCNGGNGENGLQKMLMQADGQTILLLPAWPPGWDADFKLHAPGPTTVQGSIRGGKVVGLIVTPAANASRVVDMSGLSATAPAGYGVLSPQDDVAPVRQTVQGGPNVHALPGDFDGGGNPARIMGVRDGAVGDKYFNKAPNGTKPPGIDTGFVLTPQTGPTVVNAFQIASADDSPGRDPLTVTIEGSNAVNARDAGCRDFTLLYEGSCGLFAGADRKSWGLCVNFPNATAYASYRILVTSKAGAGSDAVQYGGIRLFGTVQKPLPGANIVAPSDAVAALKTTAKGQPNIYAAAPADYSPGESAANVKDNDLHTKYFNKNPDGAAGKGGNTGLVLTPSAGPRAANGFQFATASDSPDRDPVTVTIEGSNAPDAVAEGGNGFVTLWQGPSGLASDPGRKSWGERISFWNPAPYKTYRVLVSGTRGGAVGAQYSEIRLFAP